MNILLVENHVVFAATVVEQFLTEHSVTVVSTVTGALDLFRSGSYDACLVDYDLDDFKGDVFVRRIREMGARVLVIAISARDEGNAAIIAAGADAVCHKKDFRRMPGLLARSTP